MKINFIIQYNTAFGEELQIDFDAGIVADMPRNMLMHTVDGREWDCSYNVKAIDGLQLCYHYSVRSNGTEIRTEWLTVKHLVVLPKSDDTIVTIHDRWNDIPADSYQYSSAFTECLNKRSPRSRELKFYQKTLSLKVRAPQLKAGFSLAMAGSLPSLGCWNVGRALRMREVQLNEWCANIDAMKLKDGVEYKFVAVNAETKEEIWENGFNRVMPSFDFNDSDMCAVELDEARFNIPPTKVAGTVIPVFSLRSKGSFGVGDFGDLQMFTDWAASVGQRVVQLLPVNDTTITHTWTDSYPYAGISIFAFHPQYADFRQLPELDDASEKVRFEALRKELNALPQIDYERVNNAKIEYLRALYKQEHVAMMRKTAFKKFFESNKEWLVPYAAFCHYRDIYGTATFSKWPEHKRLTDEETMAMGDAKTEAYKKVAFWYFVQYILDSQLRSAHDHARQNGIILKGDIPIGISRDGVEAWVEPKYINLNGQAGAPPDAFSVNGQNWIFPTYNWEAMLADGCKWWKRRFKKMSEYFDAYRIDHVLGFFRIWEIPINAVHGLLGQFSPALPLSREDIASYGFNFQEECCTTPFITDWVLDRIFKEDAHDVAVKYLVDCGDHYCMKPEYDTQRKVESAFRGETDERKLWTRDGLYALISDVLFVRDRKNPEMFHPRISAQLDFAYEALYDCDKQAFNRLYNDYYYHRNNDFWYGEAMKKLPLLTQATRMLVCAEDLGMVPDCVPWVMNELRILTLEIQSMPKDDKVKFGVLENNPYRSVCTISTHDMPTMRQWWDEDYPTAQQYYNNVLGKEGPAPHPMPGSLAQEIIGRNLACPSMLCLLSFQDWLSMDENIRLADANGERINIPADVRHYWRYRMHITIEALMANTEFNNKVKAMISGSGR